MQEEEYKPKVKEMREALIFLMKMVEIQMYVLAGLCIGIIFVPWMAYFSLGPIIIMIWYANKIRREAKKRKQEDEDNGEKDTN